MLGWKNLKEGTENHRILVLLFLLGLTRNLPPTGQAPYTIHGSYGLRSTSEGWRTDPRTSAPVPEAGC